MKSGFPWQTGQIDLPNAMEPISARDKEKWVPAEDRRPGSRHGADALRRKRAGRLRFKRGAIQPSKPRMGIALSRWRTGMAAGRHYWAHFEFRMILQKSIRWNFGSW